MILLTTSDYYPQIGGLSTFTKNIESVLKNLKLEYEVFHWKTVDEIKKINIQNYKLIINVHVMFAMIRLDQHENMINFIHGSEILFTSPNVIKKIVKKIFKKKLVQKIEKCHFNFFISNSTLAKTVKQGLKINYSRDFVVHNCINTEELKTPTCKEIENELIFIKIARDVPHKNIQGAVTFCEELQQKTHLKIKLILPKDVKYVSNQIEIIHLKNSSDEERDLGYSKAHYNLLLSLDHSERGFYEGFGLTILEAAKYSVPSIVFNSGGLAEAVHHNFTGYVIENLKDISGELTHKVCSSSQYKNLGHNAFEHTKNSHSLFQYELLLRKVLEKKLNV